jgi:hypothetical protein
MWKDHPNSSNYKFSKSKLYIYKVSEKVGIFISASDIPAETQTYFRRFFETCTCSKLFHGRQRRKTLADVIDCWYRITKILFPHCLSTSWHDRNSISLADVYERGERVYFSRESIFHKIPSLIQTFPNH